MAGTAILEDYTSNVKLICVLLWKGKTDVWLHDD